MYALSERDLGEAVYESLLQKRQYYDCDRFGNCRETTWSSWGRWVALVIVLLTTFLFFFLCALISARRRRLRGQYPVWGTAWVPGTNPNQNHPPKPNQWQYDPNASTYQHGDPNPPPIYSPPGNYYAPPPGPPPQQYEMQSPYVNNGQGNLPGQTTGTYFPPPSNPPPAHLQGGKA